MSDLSCAIEIQGNAHDIAGLRRLFDLAGIGISVDANFSVKETGVLVSAGADTTASAWLRGPQIDEWLLPADDARFAAILLRGPMKRLNGHGRLLDPNFEGIRAISVRVSDGMSISHFVLPGERRSKSGSTLGRHPLQAHSLKARLQVSGASDDVEFVVETLSEPPTWHSIYACFETIRHDPEIGNLVTKGLITKKQQKAFNKAANNITDREEGGRHGRTHANEKLPFDQKLDLMTLAEAEELHRQVANRYLDLKCGLRTAFEICDWMSHRPRFGLDSYSHVLSADNDD